MLISEKITLLNQITLECLSETDEIKIVKRFTDVGVKVLDADFGFAWLNSSVSKKLELVYKGSTLPYTPRPPRKGGRNYAVMKNLVIDFVIDIKEKPDTLYVSEHMESFVVIPLFFKKAVYGTIVFCFKKKEIFPENKKNLCMFIGNSIAQTITISRLLASEYSARLLAEKHEIYFKTLLENSNKIIILINPNGKIFYISSPFNKIFSYEVEDFIGNNIKDFAYDKSHHKVEKYIERILNNPNINHDTEFSYKHKDGSIHFIECTSTNMLQNESINGILMSMQDITERKHFESLRDASLLLKEEKIKTEFISNATHEIRTPLAIIKGNIDFSLMKGSKNIEFFKKTLKNINYEVDHLSSIISDLTVLTSKESMSKGGLIFKKVNLFDIINSATNRSKAIARKKNISIQINKKINKTIQKISVSGEELYLERLFINLIKNAITYGKNGGWIFIDLGKKENMIEVKISDNGIGISKDDMLYIFNRFYKKNNVANSGERPIGLGLAIVKWTAEIHGGSVSVKSEEGKGSTFTVSLPILKLD